jgi:hypothetical protein
MPLAEETKTFTHERIDRLRNMLWEILQELEDLQSLMETFQERREHSDALYEHFISDMSEVWRH